MPREPSGRLKLGSLRLADFGSLNGRDTWRVTIHQKYISMQKKIRSATIAAAGSMIMAPAAIEKTIAAEEGSTALSRKRTIQGRASLRMSSCLYSYLAFNVTRTSTPY